MNAATAPGVEGMVARLRARFANSTDEDADAARAAADLGINTEHEMRLVLAALGVTEGSNWWCGIMHPEVESEEGGS